MSLIFALYLKTHRTEMILLMDEVSAFEMAEREGSFLAQKIKLVGTDSASKKIDNLKRDQVAKWIFVETDCKELLFHSRTFL